MGIASSAINHMAFRPPNPPSYAKEDVVIWLETAHGSRLPAIFLDYGQRITVLVAHANAEDLGHSARLWNNFARRLGVNIFAFEYSGYGHSTGSPSEANLYSDARAAVAYMEKELKLRPAHDIVLVGQSLGSCTVSWLASQRKFRGMILISGLSSGARVLWPGTKMPPLDAAAFNNLAKVRRARCPIHIIHGVEDQVIPKSAAEDLHKVLPC